MNEPAAVWNALYTRGASYASIGLGALLTYTGA